MELLLFVGPPAVCWVGPFFIWTVAAFEVRRGFMPWGLWLSGAVFLVVSGICLTACVLIICTFVAHGPEGLERTHRWWWIAATIGVPLSGIPAFNFFMHRLPLLSFLSHLPPEATIWLVFGWIGVPAVVPMLHMYLEQLVRVNSRHRSGGETAG
ncbi:MAG: hypothetical protein ACREU2_13900 [Steroidobacteraceae bacterium]